MKNSAPDFSEPLRFYLSASSSTQVMQYVSKNIADTLQAMGYEVLFELAQGMEDTGSLKNMSEFKPHATINVNHLHNSFLNDAVFNFAWFQDAMPILYSSQKIVLRKRDFVFHLIKGLEQTMLNAGIQSEYQQFCMNQNIFKKREEVTKEKKIVFIGSSYNVLINNMKSDFLFDEILQNTIEIFEEKSCLTSSDIESLMQKYDKPEKYISYIYGYLTRDYCVEKLCKIDTGAYKVEIYGVGWDENPLVSKFYKGKVTYGEDISKIYNSAAYGYCVGGYVLMQRTLECAFSETIPLVLDVRADKQDTYDARVEECMQFFKINELENILTSNTQEEKDFSFIQKEYSYEKFVHRMVDIVQKELSCEQ